jgi:hypothetical protein
VISNVTKDEEPEITTQVKSSSDVNSFPALKSETTATNPSSRDNTSHRTQSSELDENVFTTSGSVVSDLVRILVVHTSQIVIDFMQSKKL